MAVVFAAIIYAGAIRASTGGRGLMAVLVALAIGIVGGIMVLLTLGIAAAFVGHTITRFAFFMTMGPPPEAVVTPVAVPKGSTADAKAYVIPPRSWPRGSDDDDGRGGVGPIRPA
jgi:hypothetical protein